MNSTLPTVTEYLTNTHAYIAFGLALTHVVMTGLVKIVQALAPAIRELAKRSPEGTSLLQLIGLRARERLFRPE